MVTDDDRISYLIGDEPAGDLDPESAPGWMICWTLLADPAIWAEPSPGLEDRIVASHRRTRRRRPAAPSRPAPEAAGPTRPAAATRPAEPAARRSGGPRPPAARRARRSSVWPRPWRGDRPRHRLWAAAPNVRPITPPWPEPAWPRQPPARSPWSRRCPGWQVTLHAKGLPRLDNGQFYQAWLKNKAGILVPIGTFNQPNDVILWSGVPPYPISGDHRDPAEGQRQSQLIGAAGADGHGPRRAKHFPASGSRGDPSRMCREGQHVQQGDQRHPVDDLTSLDGVRHPVQRAPIRPAPTRRRRSGRRLPGRPGRRRDGTSDPTARWPGGTRAEGVSPMGCQPVSSRVSRAAASFGVSPGSRRPAGISQPQRVGDEPVAPEEQDPAIGAATTVPAAGRGSRTTWCSKRSPPGTSTSTRRRLSQGLS